MIKPNFFIILILWTVSFFIFIFTFVQIVDPYGVSLISLDISGFNHYKPSRIDIDRQIKPFEVWRKQPKTVFIGTSRIQQGFPPEVLDGSRFAPAYNAAIPANTLTMNLISLKLYMNIDKNLHTAFVELFPWNFFKPVHGVPGLMPPPGNLFDMIKSSAGLFISSKAVANSLFTILYNVAYGYPCNEITRNGDLHYSIDPHPNFSGFPVGIYQILSSYYNDEINLNEESLKSVKEMIDIANAHNIELIFLLNPEYVTYDSIIEKIGAWGIMEKWLSYISNIGTIYSSSQSTLWSGADNDNSIEIYWYDVTHFNKIIGREILKMILNGYVDNDKKNQMILITKDNINNFISGRRAALQSWTNRHPDFIAQIEEVFASHGRSIPHASQ